MSVTPRTAEPHGKAEADWGAVANYTLFAAASQGAGQTSYGTFNGGSATFDARLFSPYAVARQTGIVGDTTTARGDFLRLDSTVTYADEDRLMVYRAGNSISGGLPWTRPVRFGGAQIQRSFSLRSDLVTTPMPILSGSAAVPSRSTSSSTSRSSIPADVAAGRFDIADLPVVTGGGDTQLVVRDFDRARGGDPRPVLRHPRHVAARPLRLLARGGRPRLGYGVDSFDYQPEPFGSFSLRGGATDWLTLQSHGEFSDRLENAGAGGVASVFGLGAVSAAAAMSHYDDALGGLVYASAQTRIR